MARRIVAILSDYRPTTLANEINTYIRNGWSREGDLKITATYTGSSGPIQFSQMLTKEEL